MELVFILLFWPEDPELPESILELHLVHCFPSGRIKNKGNLVQEKRKLAKMVWSGSLTSWPLTLTARFVNNDCVAAELTCSTAHTHQKVLALSWIRVVCLYELHHQSPGCCCIGATFGQHDGCYIRLYCGSVMATLWLCSGCCYDCCITQERGCVMSAMPARRE